MKKISLVCVLLATCFSNSVLADEGPGKTESDEVLVGNLNTQIEAGSAEREISNLELLKRFVSRIAPRPRPPRH